LRASLKLLESLGVKGQDQSVLPFFVGTARKCWKQQKDSNAARLYPNGRSLIDLDDGAILSLRAIQPSD